MGIVPSATYGLALTYQSHTLKDPQQGIATPDFAGLSEVNDHWTHTYAQWVDLYQDEGGIENAVWHQGGSLLSFPRAAAMTGAAFNTRESGYQISYSDNNHQGITSLAFLCNGLNTMRTVEFATFTITDADQTQYQFNSVYWQLGDCYAYPHYLLTRIQDRWGRGLNITWTNVDVRGTSEPRVTAVKDDSNTGLTLNVPAVGLMTSIVDAQSRTHTLGYTQVPQENGQPYYKLTSIQALGPGTPNRATYNWSFAYQDTSNQDYAYGGVAGDYTGDLIIKKTEPDGLVTNYQYEPVTLLGTAKIRPTEEDWVGRVTRIYWTDTDNSAKEIDRSVPNTSNQDTLTFPGGVQVQYTYSGTDVTAVKDLSTGRQWQYTYDGWHNLTSVRSPLETGVSPLVQYAPTVDPATGHISQVIEQVLQADGSLNNPVTTLFNSLNLPTQITAAAVIGSGHPD